MIKNLLFLLFFSLTITVSGQEGRLAAFSAVRIDASNIEIRWTMKAGVSCQSPEVQRSTDGINFESIYRYPGVCGGGQFEESFNWIDNRAPADRSSYYRLKIDEGEFSAIDFVELDILYQSGKDVLVLPNPSNGEFQIKFKEELGKLNRYTFYRQDGSEILVESGLDNRETVLDIDLRDLGAQLYYVQLEFEGGLQKVVKVVVIL